eukprot:7094470-Pyramimonas_sp.AAC.1
MPSSPLSVSPMRFLERAIHPSDDRVDGVLAAAAGSRSKGGQQEAEKTDNEEDEGEDDVEERG